MSIDRYTSLHSRNEVAPARECVRVCVPCVCVPVESAVTRFCVDVTVHMHVIGGNRERRVITYGVLGLSVFFCLFVFSSFFFLYRMWMACWREIVIGRCGRFVVFVEFVVCVC